jgi:PAS domain S-box-containing protein
MHSLPKRLLIGVPGRPLHTAPLHSLTTCSDKGRDGIRHAALPLHARLQSQLEACFPQGTVPTGRWDDFLAAINASYFNADAERTALLQAIPDLLMRLDANGRILAATFGTGDDYLRQQTLLPGQRIEESFLRDVAAEFTKALQQVLEGRPADPQEFNLGSVAIYEARFFPIKEGEAFAVIRNISARRGAEERLRETSSLQQSILDSTTDGILVMNLAGQVVSFNRRFAQMWGLREEKLAAKSESDFLEVVQSMLTNPAAFIDRVRELQTDLTAESCDLLRFLDGRIVERYSAPQIMDGLPIGRVWIFRDITERLMAEEALRAEEERFRLVTQATRDAIYDWNLESGTIWRSEGFIPIYGEAQTIGADNAWWEQQLHPDDRHRVSQSLAEALVRREQTWAQQYRFRRADNSYATLSDRGYLIYNENGQPHRMVGAIADISESKKLEAQYLQSQKMEAVGQLAGGVAHDFNNLLTVIIGNLSLLQLEGSSATDQAAATAECLKAAKRAANLTRQLLTFSRREKVMLKPIDLNEVVSEMTKMVQRLVGEHIQIQAAVSPGKLMVRADAGMLEQLVMNLVVNARDAMPRGGRLQIQAEAVTLDAKVNHDLHPQARSGNFVHLKVRDNGTGISPENLKHIFEPFFTTKESGKGTGLGLATVFGIVRQHDGWIEVESELNLGTTMHVYLPRLAETSSTAVAVPEASQPLVGGAESILIAEDDEQVRLWMQHVLQRAGYNVHAVGTGQAAIECFNRKQGKVDLLITDMIMPGGITGRDLKEMLSASRPELKYLYCSGYTEEQLMATGAEGDEALFLEKPLELDAFLQRIRERLDG